MKFWVKRLIFRQMMFCCLLMSGLNVGFDKMLCHMSEALEAKKPASHEREFDNENQRIA